MQVLGLETSCDETGVALYDTQRGLLAHALYSQAPLHEVYGGVVPELASRDHISKTIPLIRRVLAKTEVTGSELNGVAYTAGPGLAGALLVGVSIGKSLAYGWGIPAIALHHLEGHLLAPMLEEEHPEFPFIALLVSGGHTLLVKVEAVSHYEILGESLDDAAGEALDKIARLLDLGYPGGPALSALAEQGEVSRFKFPRPMTERPGLDFSFSGLKTFAANTYRETDHSPQTKADIARAFIDALVDTLVIKCRRALQKTGLRTLVAVGGVSANLQLRAKLADLAVAEKARVYYPRPEFCTDNGAMIAYAGALRLQAGHQEPGLDFSARPRWPLVESATVGSR